MPPLRDYDALFHPADGGADEVTAIHSAQFRGRQRSDLLAASAQFSWPPPFNSY